jgi:Leucine-rich repeat (LRR) protein
MKKLILLFLVLALKFIPAKAQWVTIPDANFVTWLTTNYPSCMNGNQMDTTCSAIVNTTNIEVSDSYISDLTGVEYFANLSFLTCNDNQLTSLPALPNTLMQLQCINNQESIIHNGIKLKPWEII